MLVSDNRNKEEKSVSLSKKCLNLSGELIPMLEEKAVFKKYTSFSLIKPKKNLLKTGQKN